MTTLFIKQQILLYQTSKNIPHTFKKKSKIYTTDLFLISYNRYSLFYWQITLDYPPHAYFTFNEYHKTVFIIWE